MNKAGFEELKPILKDKWLDYYEANQSVVDKLMELSPKRSYDHRPHSNFIIGIVSYLEPRLEDYLFCFFLVCTNLDKIVEVLGLHFDPKLELEKRQKQNCTHEQHNLAVSEVA